MSAKITRHVDGVGPVEFMAYWQPIPWHIWDDEAAMPAGIPADVWTTHHGHQAALRWSMLGFHTFRCSDCDYTWHEEPR